MDPLAWLAGRERFGIKLGLGPVRALLEGLGSPHRQRPAVIVAGTNGKGSTAAMTAALLTAAGLRTLLYMSPHVASVRERIRVDGRPISAAALARRLARVRQVSRRLVRTGGMPHEPTYFEALTAAAFLHGSACRADVLVLEVGMGGRFDATAVAEAPVALLTGIDRDHVRYLGRSLRRIAWNKAGVIADGATALTLESKPGPLAVFAAECRARGARLLRPSRPAAVRLGPARWDLDLALARRAGADRLPGRLQVSLGLRGPRQGAQATLAVAGAAAICRLIGHRLPGPAGVRRALAGVRLPGRMELRRLRGKSLLVTDAAHNPAGMAALAEEIPTLAGDRPITLLFGVLEDKDAGLMLKALKNKIDTVILTSPRHRRGLPVALLRAAATAAGLPVAASRQDPQAAWNEAIARTAPGGVLLVTGSFYLLGDLWGILSRRPPVSTSGSRGAVPSRL